MPRLSALAAVSLATTLTASAWGQTTISARPGTITYIEGQASLGTATTGQSLNGQSSDMALRAGQTLETTVGRAEVQLTPGIFLRVGQNSSVKMISPSLIHTVVEVQRGRAEVEVDQLYQQNDVQVVLGSGQGGSSQTRLVKPGLYEFDAEVGLVRVFEGRAEISLGPNVDKPVTIKGGHLLALNGDSLKPKGFDKKRSNDELTAWGDLRSQYNGQENAGLVQSAGGGYGPGYGSGYGTGFAGYGNGFGGGGYDLGFGAYPWFPGGGFYSPFGFGLGSGFYGGPFGFAGLGYPGLGYGFSGGYPGYGFGGLGGSGYGGVYGGGYAGGSGGTLGRHPVQGNRGGSSGQFSNHAGTGQPGPGRGSLGASRGAQPGGAGASVSRGAGSGGAGVSRGAGSGGFGGGGGGHIGGGGSHR